jgi:phosphatidate phosphatase APP1
VHQPEPGEPLRRGFIAALVWFLKLERGGQQAQNLNLRLRYFLVDNKRKRKLSISVMDQTFELGPSDLQGHFHGEVELDSMKVSASAKSGLLEVAVLSPNHPSRAFLGHVILVPRSGLSVISDVDDTIKNSNVLDKKALIRNTFLNPYEPVQGMADVYQRLAGIGAVFHFVSCSPWHLYPELVAFLNESGFPPATLTMKRLRLKDSSLYEFFSTPDAFKFPRITAILRTFPERRFLLIGDSGERDPEIYGQVAREYPTQILGILIRDVSYESIDSPRLRAAFQGLPAERCRLFGSPSELTGFLSSVEDAIRYE